MNSMKTGGGQTLCFQTFIMNIMALMTSHNLHMNIKNITAHLALALALPKQ